MSVSLYKPRHRATNAITDGRSRTNCWCPLPDSYLASTCPVHMPHRYATFAAAHDADVMA